MFETTVANGTKELGLQEEVTETGRVNTDVAALLVDIVTSSELALLAVGGGRGGLVATDLLIGVINEILLVRHVVGLAGYRRWKKMLEMLLLAVPTGRIRVDKGYESVYRRVTRSIV